MNKIDFVLATCRVSPKSAKPAAQFTTNPLVWSAIETIFHSRKMVMLLGTVDPQERFVEWLHRHPMTLYRMVRLQAYRQRVAEESNRLLDLIQRIELRRNIQIKDLIQNINLNNTF